MGRLAIYILLLVVDCLWCHAQTTVTAQAVAEKQALGCEQNLQKKVAFFATLRENFGPVSQNTDLAFDNLETNVGSAFDKYSGRFTAPVRATYQFSVTLGAQHGKIAAVSILKNGKSLGYVWTESTAHFSTSSSTFAISLEAGDKIWLQVPSAQSYVYGYQLTTFTGILIFEN